MERESVTPRPDWQKQCEDVGFNYHSMDGVYWDERFCYRFTSEQIDTLDDATVALHELCLKAVEHIVAERRFDELKIPAAFHEYVIKSWQSREPSVFGRFDLAWDGNGPPKMLEYNADTPTALLESSVAQWDWLEQAIIPSQPSADQFNSLHEKLIARWKVLH
jgi:glutathionylspermidine synthase